MSFIRYWRELGHFWLALAMWAATKCFSIVNIYAPEDIVVGLVWSNDEALIRHVMDYHAKEKGV